MNFPCENCITASICKAMLDDQNYIFKDLTDKCTLFREYIHEPVPVAALKIKLNNVEKFFLRGEYIDYPM